MNPEPTHSPLHMAVVIGSTREGRNADLVANWFVDRVDSFGDFLIDLVDVAELDLPVRHAHSPSVQTYSKRMHAADCFVVVTPEYNHSYPASLKHAIDVLKDEWYRKPVAFVSYGGISGGLRAVEHLRNVFAELHATTIRDTVSFQGPWQQFDSNGLLANPEMAEVAATTMLDELAWWTRTLRSARAAPTDQRAHAGAA